MALLPSYIYIAGCTRSGSTALGSELASRTGAAHVGELHHFWRSAVENRLCGCGSRFRECPFWQEIADSIGLDDDELSSILRIKTELLSLPRWLLHGARPTYWEALDQPTESLLSALAAKVPAIVDSSKNPAFLDLICGCIGAPKVYVSKRPISELRDSWRSEKPDPDSPAGVMPTKSATQVYRESVAVAACMSAVRRRRQLLVEVVRSSDGKFDVDLSRLGPLGGGVNHTLAGNPNRHNAPAGPGTPS